jgi:post-segregation antitoxin (ccd killing protein)
MSVYIVCMARINVYVPDELARAAREAGLNVSSLTQAALKNALAPHATNAWLRSLTPIQTGATHEQVMEALDAARDEFGA